MAHRSLHLKIKKKILNIKYNISQFFCQPFHSLDVLSAFHRLFKYNTQLMFGYQHETTQGASLVFLSGLPRKWV